jgi:hypothetical protein
MKVPRSLQPQTGYSVGGGIRDGSHAGRRSSRTRSSDRLAERGADVIGNEPFELAETAGESHLIRAGKSRSTAFSLQIAKERLQNGSGVEDA